MKEKVNKVYDILSDRDKAKIRALEDFMKETKSKELYNYFKSEIADIIKNALDNYRNKSA